jgi:hypothetical protein
MIRLATVIDTFEADFLTQYRHKLSFDHLRALAAMKHCRTQSSLKMRVKCTECAHETLVPHSCGHRHGPHCPHPERQTSDEEAGACRVFPDDVHPAG